MPKYDKRLVHKVDNSVNLKIKLRKVTMKIDTCPDVNLLDEVTFDKLKEAIHLKPTNIKLYGYHSNVPLTLLGKFSDVLEAKNKLVVA